MQRNAYIFWFSGNIILFPEKYISNFIRIEIATDSPPVRVSLSLLKQYPQNPVSFIGLPVKFAYKLFFYTRRLPVI